MKKLLSRKIWASVLTFCVILSGVFCPKPSYAYDGSLKNYIILTDVPSLLSPERPAFFSRGEGFEEQYRNELISYQNSIIDEIISKRFSLSGFGDEPQRPFSYHFTDVLSGFTLEMTEDEAQKAQLIDGVSLVAEDTIIATLNEGESTEVTSDNGVSSDIGGEKESYAKLNAGNMIGVPEARALGYSGEGRVIAVIDSSIQPLHPYLKLSDTTQPRYTQEDINAIINSGILNVKSPSGVYRTEKVPFAYDYCYNKAEISSKSDHGLHVSGIVAGNGYQFNTDADKGLIEGVAPEAQIIFMGIFNTSGGAALSTLCAALDDASKLGVDAVNMSIGVPSMSENYKLGEYAVLKEIAKNANANGISLIYAAGNDGHEGALLTTEPDYNIADNSLFPSVMRVGSVQNEYAYFNYVEDENGNKYPCEQVGKDVSFDLTDLVILTDTSSQTLSGAKDKVAVVTVPDITKGKMSLSQVAKSGYEKGVKAFVFINNINQILDGTASINIPVLYMPKAFGEELKEKAAKLKFSPERMVQRIHASSPASHFSSFGVTDNLDISIDFSAPGGHIFSSAPSSGMGNKSGTSMSAPFLTGAISLLYERIESEFSSYKGADKTLLARQLLSSTAKNVYEENGALSSVRQVGSGLVQINKALITNVVLTSVGSLEYPSINLGDNLDESFNVSFKVKNLSSSPVSFGNVSAELSCEDYITKEGTSLNYYNGMKKLSAQVSPYGKIDLSGGEEKIVTLTVTPDKNTLSELDKVMTNGYFIDGKISLSDSDENCDVTIPFTGFRKSWAMQKVLTPSDVTDSTYLLAMSSNGTYSYCFPEYKDGKYIIKMSDTPSENLFSGNSYIVTVPERNAYLTLKGSFGVLSEEMFALKKKEFVLPLSSFKEVSESTDAISLEMRLPYGDSASHTQIVELLFEKDNSAPVVSIEDSQGMAVVTAEDDTLVTTITAKGKNALGKETLITKELDKSGGNVTLDVSALSDVDFYVYDKGFNCTFISHGLYFEKTFDKVFLKNINKTSCEGNVFIASYKETDGKKTLNKIEKLSEKISLLPYGEKEIDISSFIGESYTIFYWDVEKGYVPLAKFQ